MIVVDVEVVLDVVVFVPVAVVLVVALEIAICICAVTLVYILVPQIFAHRIVEVLRFLAQPVVPRPLVPPVVLTVVVALVLLIVTTRVPMLAPEHAVLVAHLLVEIALTHVLVVVLVPPMQD